MGEDECSFGVTHQPCLLGTRECMVYKVIRIQARPTVLDIVTFDSLDNAFECFPGSFRCDI